MNQIVNLELRLDPQSNDFHAFTFLKGDNRGRWLIVNDNDAEVFAKIPTCHVHADAEAFDTNITKFHRLLFRRKQEQLRRMMEAYSSCPSTSKHLKPAIEDLMEQVELQHRKLTRMLDKAFVQYEQSKNAEEEKPAEATAPAPLEPSEFPTEWHHLQNLTKNTD